MWRLQNAHLRHALNKYRTNLSASERIVGFVGGDGGVVDRVIKVVQGVQEVVEPMGREGGGRFEELLRELKGVKCKVRGFAIARNEEVTGIEEELEVGGVGGGRGGGLRRVVKEAWGEAWDGEVLGGGDEEEEEEVGEEVGDVNILKKVSGEVERGEKRQQKPHAAYPPQADKPYTRRFAPLSSLLSPRSFSGEDEGSSEEECGDATLVDTTVDESFDSDSVVDELNVTRENA